MSTKTHQEYEQTVEESLQNVRNHLASGKRSAQVIQQCERSIYDAKMSIHALQGLAEIEGDKISLGKQRKRLQQEVTPLMEQILQIKRTMNVTAVHQPQQPSQPQYPSNRYNNNSMTSTSAGGGGNPIRQQPPPSSLSAQQPSFPSKKKITATGKKSNAGGSNRKESEMTSLFSNEHNEGSTYVPPRIPGMDDHDDVEGTPALSQEHERLISESRDLLMESQALCNESEEIGYTTLNRMTMQREQLENSNDAIERTKQIALEAKEVITQMSRRALKNKIFLYCVIAFLIFANLWVLYRIIVGRKRPDQ